MAVGSLLAVGALALLGIGGAVLVARLLRDSQSQTESLFQRFRDEVATLPAALPPVEPRAQAPKEPKEEGLQWSTARIVLGGLPDPYNPMLDLFAKQRNEQKALDSDVGQVYQLTRKVLGYIPYVGQVITLLSAFMDFLGSLVPPSSGGFAQLSPLARQRMVLYRLFPQFDRPSPFPSQVYDRTAEKPEPLKGYERTPANIAVYETKLRAWLRRFYLENAILAESYRVKNTPDEAMLPALVIDLLIQANEWPPPLEPVPPTRELWLAQRSDLATGYPVDFRQLDLAEPLTMKVYEELQAQYREDAKKFQNRIAAVRMPPDVLTMARQWGSIPRIGTLAAPIAAPAKRADRF